MEARERIEHFVRRHHFFHGETLIEDRVRIVRRVFARFRAPITHGKDDAVEAQMSTTLERATSGAAATRPKPDKFGNRTVTAGLGEGFEFAFAVFVLLGALWLLASGYV